MIKKQKIIVVLIISITVIVITLTALIVVGKISPFSEAGNIKPILVNEPLKNQSPLPFLSADKMKNLNDIKMDDIIGINENGWIAYKMYFDNVQFSIPENFKPFLNNGIIIPGGFAQFITEKDSEGILSVIIYDMISDKRQIDSYESKIKELSASGGIYFERETTIAEQKVIVVGLDIATREENYEGEKILILPSRSAWIAKDGKYYRVTIKSNDKNIDDVFNKVIISFRFTK